jgi:hypothetical protein
MVMLIIMIIGTAVFLVTSLGKATLSIERNKASSDLLARAKEVVIGYALNGTAGSQPPGNLTYPDVLSEATPDYNGSSEGGCLNALQLSSAPIPGLPLISSGINMRCFGRLPWKTFNFPIPSPTENDPAGIMPWYAISTNMIDATPFNSELLNTAPYPWITVRDMNGNVISNRVAFVIIVPGAPISNQSRSPSLNLDGANQYLEGITVPNGCAAPCVPGTYNNFDMRDEASTSDNAFGFIMGEEHRWIDDPANPGKQIDDPTYQFNDKLIYVTIDDLMPLIEKRIAREVKACLDDYATFPTNGSHKYPWATPISDTTAYPNRTGAYNVFFGRISDIPSNVTSPPPTLTAADTALKNKILDLQTAFAAYQDGSGTISNLQNKGDALKDFAHNPPYNQSSGNPAYDAGRYADNWTVSSSETTMASLISSALDVYSASKDSTMPNNWGVIPSCNALFTSGYWQDWRNLVFYQIANGYQPGSAGSCTTGTTCLSISGSGNTVSGSGTYRATVAVAGKMRPGQARATSADQQVRTNYLENLNTTNKTDIPTSVVFETYKTSDSSYQNTSNDLVLCLDGKTNNPNSVCQ